MSRPIHVTVDEACDGHAARRAMDTLIHDRFDIEHPTLQVDHEHEDLLTIELLAPPGPAAPSS
jgi:cobalt-zinc-cadmium efflux system protein